MDLMLGRNLGSRVDAIGLGVGDSLIELASELVEDLASLLCGEETARRGTFVLTGGALSGVHSAVFVCSHLRSEEGRDRPLAEFLVHSGLSRLQAAQLEAERVRQHARVVRGGHGGGVPECLSRSLSVLESRHVGRSERLIDLDDSLVHSDLLNDRASQLEVVVGNDHDSLLGQILLGEAVLQHERPNVGNNAHAERLLASDKGETASQVLHHKVGGLPHRLLVALHGKVLDGELAGRDAGDSDRAFYDGRDDLRQRNWSVWASAIVRIGNND